MKCLVCLGNPGNRYKFTRHNIGFLAGEFLCATWNAAHVEGNPLYELYAVGRGEEKIMILLPQTYMNNSGFAVREFRQQHELPLKNMLVIFDDFQLPFGTIRLRPKGSDGGHNGMASIIYQLESELIPRLRLGIAGDGLPEHHTHELMAEYVLSTFTKNELSYLEKLMNRCCDAVTSWIDVGISKTMSSFNRNFLNDADAS